MNYEIPVPIWVFILLVVTSSALGVAGIVASRVTEDLLSVYFPFTLALGITLGTIVSASVGLWRLRRIQKLTEPTA